MAYVWTTLHTVHIDITCTDTDMDGCMDRVEWPEWDDGV